jgi:hypothetical protein
LPLLFGGFGSLFCGFISGRMERWLGSVKMSRRLLASTGFFGASMFLLGAIHLENPVLAMLSMGLASFCNDLVMPGAWGACMDIGGKYAGTLSGSMNMMGNMAGFVAPMMGGYILQQTNNDWNIFLYVMAGVYFAGTFCWPLIDPVTPLFDARGLRVKGNKYAPSIGLGLLGFLWGGLVAFIIRPSADQVGQLPLSTVMLRGSNLGAADQALIATAQASFNVMIAGSLIGVAAGLTAAYLIKVKAKPRLEDL